MFKLVSRIGILGALLIGGVAALAVAACGGETETIIQTVVVEKQVPAERVVEKVVETVVVEKVVEGKTVTQIQTVVVEREVTVTEKVIETVVVEKVVEGRTVTEIQTVVVERPVTVVETVVIEKPVTVTEKVVETVVVKEQEVITVVATATPGAPSGLARPAPGTVLRAAVNDVGSANFLSPRAVHPNDNRNHEMSVFETMIIQEGTQGGLVNVSIIGWELDGLVFRAQLHPRVEFHQGWGPATAHDWEYSWERTQEEGAVNSAGATIRNEWDSWKAIDDLTFEATLRKPNVNFRRALIFGTYLHSKAAVEEMGDDWADQNAIGTGPYELKEIAADDKIVLSAVQGHYRETPWYETVEILEVPDANTRIAQMRTGEIDLMPVGIPQVDQVSGVPGVRIQSLPQVGRGGSTIFFGGQYYVGPGSPTWDISYAGHLETVTSRAGDSLAIERDLDAALMRPWVGPYLTDKAENEKAIMVRRAMTHAVDRNLINEVILGGKGCIGHMYLVDECHPRWDTSLNVDYDVEKAKQLLQEAGYGDGFEFPVWIPTMNDTFVEVSEAMLEFWKDVGLNPVVQKTAYTARRPLIISRKMNEVWFMGHGTGVLPFGGVFQWSELNGRGVWGQNIEYDELGELADRMFVAVGDENLQWTIQREYWDFHYANQLTGGGVYWNNLWAVGPRVAAWEAQFDSTRVPVQLERVIPGQVQ